mgnify:CR=1 FL=1
MEQTIHKLVVDGNVAAVCTLLAEGGHEDEALLDGLSERSGRREVVVQEGGLDECIRVRGLDVIGYRSDGVDEVR